MSNYSIEVQSNHLAAVRHFTADRDVRYYLNGVLIEATAKETRVVATDGHAAAVHRSTAKNVIGDAPVVAIIVPNDTLASLAKILPKKGCDITFTLSGGQWTIETPYARISFDPIDGRFPDYRAIIPAQPTGEVSQLNPELLVKFSKAAKSLGAKGHPIVQHNGSSTALVTIHETEDFVGVIAPLRTKDLHLVPTDWARQSEAA